MRQIIWCVVIEVQPGFGVGSPGVFGCQSKFREKCEINSIPHLQLARMNPFGSQPKDLAISREFHGITRHAVNPSVTDFLRQNRQGALMRLHGIGDLGQVRSSNRSLRKLLSQICIDLSDFFHGVRARIVVTNLNRHGQV